MQTEPTPSDLDVQLADAREQFLAFVRRRIADPDLAEDVLQDAYEHAMWSAPELRDEERLTAWFYRILRNAIIDAYRRRDVRGRRGVSLGALDVDFPEEPSDEGDRLLCECFRALVPTLSPGYANLIEAVELGDESPDSAAARLGITRNNLKVRRHRARRALRARLEETCRLCAEHGCLDCSCEDGAPAV